MSRENPANIPPPKETFTDQEVRDYERKRYRGLDQRLVHAREARLLKRMLEKTGEENVRILDLPCGYGRFSRMLRDRGGSLVSCDLSLSMVKRALEREGRRESHAGVAADALHGIPLRTGCVDLVFSMRFFHHLHEAKDRKRLLSEFARVTSRWVILSFYRMNLLHRLQRKLRKRLKRSRTRIRMIAGKEFLEELRESGLRVVEARPVFRGIHAQHILLLEKIPGSDSKEPHERIKGRRVGS